MLHMLSVMGDLTQEHQPHRLSATPPVFRTPIPQRTQRCFNCNEEEHFASACMKIKRERGYYYSCGSMAHMKRNCPKRTSDPAEVHPDSTTMIIEDVSSIYEVPVKLEFDTANVSGMFSLRAMLDSGINFGDLAK